MKIQGEGERPPLPPEADAHMRAGKFLSSTIHRKRVCKCMCIKRRVQCFSMQVVINKCFPLNPEKGLVQIHLVVFEKNAKNAHFNFEK